MSKVATWVLGALVTSAALAGIGFVQPHLAADAKKARTKADIFLLPPARELKVMAIGYDSALCDVLWAKLLIEYGRHWQERRVLEHADLRRFLDGILELDRDFLPIYKYADTLLVYRPPKGEREDAIAAREYLERGTREHPKDPAIWLHYGEFVSYLGPSWLDESERDAWYRDGALAVVHAVELGAKADRTLAAASLLNRAGEREAARTALERAYAVAEDQETREDIRRQLERIQTSATADERERRRLLLERRRVRTFPSLSTTSFLLLGPTKSPLACLGPGSSARPECPSSWSDAFAK